MTEPDERQITKDETLSLFTFQQRETLIALAAAMIASALILLFVRKYSIGMRCEDTVLNLALWSILIPSFLVSFWGVIGLIRFFRNDQRRLGQTGNLTGLDHLSFLLPCLTLLAIWAGPSGLITVSMVAVLLLVVAFTIHRQSLGVHVLIIPGNILFSVIALAFVSLGVMFSAMLVL